MSILFDHTASARTRGARGGSPHGGASGIGLTRAADGAPPRAVARPPRGRPPAARSRQPTPRACGRP
eukprot:1657933-Prymnesium_polylepis.1